MWSLMKNHNEQVLSWLPGILQVTAATCTRSGSGYYPCSACGGKVYTSIPATGHSWGSWQIAQTPTASRPGKLKHTCGRCGTTEYKNMN